MKTKQKIISITASFAAICILFFSLSLLSEKDNGTDFEINSKSFFRFGSETQGETKIIDTSKTIDEWDKDFFTDDERLKADENMQAGLLKQIPSGMESVCIDGNLELLFNFESAEFAVKNIKSGAIWTSGPQDINYEKVAAGDNLTKMASSIIIDYSTDDGSVQSYDSYNYSVALGKFTAAKIKDGVRIDYQIGEQLLVTSNDVPNVISKARLESFLAKLSETAASDTKRRYRLYSLNDAESEEEKQELIKEYPNILKYDVYVLRDKEDMLLSMIKENLELAGYTVEDLKLDNKENNIKTEIKDTQVFYVTLEIKLKDNKLIAEIDGKKFKSPKKNPLYNIHILPFFGAANLKSKGYMFVPDGSGGLVYLNSFSNSNEEGKLPLYGSDQALRMGSPVNPVMQTCMPVYGLKNGDEAFFAVIEKGDGCATVNFNSPGIQNSYNCIWPSFNINPKDSFDLVKSNLTGGMVYSILYPSKLYNENLKIVYSFFSGEDASYTGFAKEYRVYLQSNKKMNSAKSNENELPFILETVGVIDKPASLLGIVKYNKRITMTSFKQTQDIVGLLKNEGINNISLKLSGWMNGGMSQTQPDSVKVLSDMGGASGLSDLLCYLKNLNIIAFADLQMQIIKNPGLFYDKKNNAIRYLGDVYANTNRFDEPSGEKLINVSPEYLLSPTKFPKLSGKLSSAYEKLSMPGISISDLAKNLYSNFSKKDFINRDGSISTTINALDILAKGRKMMVDTGNVYAIKNAQKIVNMPIGGSGYRKINESVPFYQMVIHGYIDYSGKPLNHADDSLNYSLQCVEYGACPYFQWSYAPSSLTKATEYNKFYSVCYKNTYENAVKYYKKLNISIGKLSGKLITGHRKISSNVSLTTYEGGGSVIVNYNNYDVIVNGVSVKAQDWAVTEGE